MCGECELKMLLLSGTDVGQTPLTWEVGKDDLGIVELLIVSWLTVHRSGHPACCTIRGPKGVQ